MSQKKMTEQEKQARVARILMIISGHVGQDNKIGMGELYERVFEKTYSNRINDTRPLRKIVKKLRKEGFPILSDVGGYWQAATADELKEYCAKRRSGALGVLRQESNMRKIAMPELVGQLPLDLKKPERR